MLLAQILVKREEEWRYKHVGHELRVDFSLSLVASWRRQWHPTPVLLPGKSHGRRSLIGWSPWGRWGSDTTERLHFRFSLSCIGEGNGNPLQCSCQEDPRDGGAWWAAIYGVAQSRTRLKQLSLWLQGGGPNPSTLGGAANSVLALDSLWASDIVGKAQSGSVEIFIQADGTGETLMILSVFINSTYPALVGISSEGTEASTINMMPVVTELAVLQGWCIILLWNGMLEKEHTAAGYTHTHTHTHTSYTKAQTFFSLLITHFETSCIFFSLENWSL